MENQNSAPHTSNATHAANKNVAMAVLSYIGPLVIISYLTAKDDPFVKFHIKQGLILFIIEILLWIISPFFWPIWILIRLVNLGILILAVIGIINASQGKEKELPVVGGLSKHFKF